MLVTVPPGAEAELARRCADAGQAAARLGEVGGDALAIEGVDPLPLAELAALSPSDPPRRTRLSSNVPFAASMRANSRSSRARAAANARP